MVDFDPNIDRALRALREREFRAGRYFPALKFPQYPVGSDSPAPGPQHASMEEAQEDVAEVGTYSILDLDHVSEVPEACGLTALKDDQLLELYGTTRPTREMVEFENGWAEFVDRAQGVYVIVYQDEEPRWLFSGGRAFD
jgi:hypothetical protein